MNEPREPGREWFETAFGKIYPLLYAHRDDESAAFEAVALVNLLGLKSGGTRILDVCCGSGRHVSALSALGFDVTAFDLSPSLIKEAAGRPEIRGRLVRADMRALPFGTLFNQVFNLFTSFGYFFEDAENEHALKEMVRVLLPGGRLVLDHMNRASVEKELVAVDTRVVNGINVIQKRRIENDRIVKDITLEGGGGKQMQLTENVRLYKPEEMESMLRTAGMIEVEFFGGFQGGAFSENSRRMIAVARKGRE